MEKLILVNLKMYQTDMAQIENYLNKLKGKRLIFFPMIIHLERFISHNFTCGTQNISTHESGAYTGEISAKAAQNIGASCTLIGHSEVRQNFNETDEIINQKIKISLKNKLIPILCIGENLNQYQANQTKMVIKNQIEKALKDITEPVIISYEPLWAIGTGKTPTNEEIKDIIDYIKSLFNYKIKVLYGGSVSQDNIETLNKIENVDGFLIGKAGLDVSCLTKIIEVVQK